MKAWQISVDQVRQVHEATGAQAAVDLQAMRDDLNDAFDWFLFLLKSQSFIRGLGNNDRKALTKHNADLMAVVKFISEHPIMVLDAKDHAATVARRKRVFDAIAEYLPDVWRGINEKPVRLDIRRGRPFEVFFATIAATYARHYGRPVAVSKSGDAPSGPLFRFARGTIDQFRDNAPDGWRETRARYLLAIDDGGVLKRLERAKQHPHFAVKFRRHLGMHPAAT